MDTELTVQLIETLKVMTDTSQMVAELGAVLTKRVLELEGRVKQLEDEVRIGNLHVDEALDRLGRAPYTHEQIDELRAHLTHGSQESHD